MIQVFIALISVNCGRFLLRGYQVMLSCKLTPEKNKRI